MPSDAVGLAVLERLRTLDPVSYLRFASVYKGFEDVADFEAEVVELQKRTHRRPTSRDAAQKTTAPKTPEPERPDARSGVCPGQPELWTGADLTLTRMELQCCNSPPISR